MPFEFQVIDARYEGIGDDEVTVITGYVMKGAIDEPELVVLPTQGGLSYKFAMAGMQVYGSKIRPLTPDDKTRIELVLWGQPPEQDVIVPTIAVTG